MLEFNATFFVAMFSFIIFMRIMNSILYEPLERIQKERADVIKSENEATKLTEEKTVKLKQQQQANIEKSKDIARDNFNKKVSEFKERKETILSTARDLAKKDLAISNAELKGDEKEAKLLLKSQINLLASAVATKILNTNLEIID